MRVIGIVGPHHCGSTALSRLFAAVPGVASLGEVSHFTRKWRAYWIKHHGYDPIRQQGPLCSGCRKLDCPVYPATLAQFYPDPGETYARFSYGAPVVVVSDKEPRRYADMVALGDLEVVLLFRHPEAMVESLGRRYNRRPEQARLEYARGYRDLLAWSSRAKARLVVSWDDLTRDPEGRFGALCRRLGLPEVHPLPELTTIVHHHIGGDKPSHARPEIVPAPERRAVPGPADGAYRQLLTLASLPG